MAEPELPTSETPRSTLFSRELRLRIISGFAVGAIALGMLFAGPKPFALLMAGIAAAMSWEWGRIVRGGDGQDVITVLHIATSLAAAALTGLGMAGIALAVVAIGAITSAALATGVGRPVLTGIGVLYTSLPVIALAWLRGSDGPVGLLAVLFIVLAVVATDTAAYFTGRGLGGPKLWPAVSPNKTWSGLIGGVTAAAIVGALFPMLTGSGYGPWLAVLGCVLGLVAQGGDLAESSLKRHFGRKDASDLIPGHGGFMDRMDGIVTASVMAALIAFAIEAHTPARALLYGA